MTSVALKNIFLALAWRSTLPLEKYSGSASEVFIMHKMTVLMMCVCLSVTESVSMWVCLLSVTTSSLLMSVFFVDLLTGIFRGTLLFTQISQKQLSSSDACIVLLITILHHSITHNYTEHVPHHLSAFLCACLCLCMCVKWWVCESYRPSWPLTSH